MISKRCSIEEFVEVIKGKDPQEVIGLAIQEATKADRIVLKKRKQFRLEHVQNYSRQLKQLINYHRYASKPQHHLKTTYNLYMKYWGDFDPFTENILPSKVSTELMINHQK